jgi:hypothetical protein
MSYIANTAFETRVTNGRFDDLQNITGRYQASAADADCSAGLLCVRAGQLPCEGFTGVYNENAWYMNAAAATATADDVIYAANPYDWQLIKDARGNAFSVGHTTLGLGIPAGRNGTFTRIDFDGQHVYRFGIGNLSAAIGSNTFFTIADGLLVPAAAAPTDAGSIYFELHGTGAFTEGASAGFTYYDVIAKKVTA